MNRFIRKHTDLFRLKLLDVLCRHAGRSGFFFLLAGQPHRDSCSQNADKRTADTDQCQMSCRER